MPIPPTDMEWLQATALDIRYAARRLRRSPLFTIVATTTLAIGVGATTAVFSAVNATLLRPLPYPSTDALVDVHTRFLDGRATTGLVSAVELDALNDVPTVVARATGYSGQPFDAALVRDDDSAIGVRLTGVTSGFFDVLGLPMFFGRGFTDEEHVPAGRDAPTSTVLSYRAWMMVFGGDRAVVGRAIRVPDLLGTVTVVGIASPNLDLPRDTDLWFSLRTPAHDQGHFLIGLVRLRPGATLEQLRGAAVSAMSNVARVAPNSVGREYVFRSLTSALVGELGPTLVILLGATTVLLVLACVNVTNLLLARGATRTREVAIRTAIGATHGRIVRHLLAESLVLATVGAVAGLLLGYVGIRLLLVLGASKLPRLDVVPFDSRVLLFVLAVLLFAALAISLAPALRLTARDVSSLLKDGERTGNWSGTTSRIMSSMIVAEIAFAIVLVAGAGWLVQSVGRLRANDPGFTAAGRLVVDVRTTRTFSERAAAQLWLEDLQNRIRTTSASAWVGTASTFPLRPNQDSTTNIELDTELPDLSRVRSSHMRTITPGFLEAMDIAILAGRAFTADDRSGTQRVVLVNRAFARRYLAGRDPLTVSIAYGAPTPNRQALSRIVGVVEDVRYVSLAADPEPTVYLPLSQAPYLPRRYSVVVAPGIDPPEALTSSIMATLEQFDPQMIFSVSNVSTVIAEAIAGQELPMTLMLVFGAMALALAAVGIYGAITYVAAQRTNEIALRLALGASSRHAFWLVIGAAQRLVLVGVLIGLGAAYLGGRVVSSAVFEMRASDPTVLVGACALVALVAGAATLVPAINASRIDVARCVRLG